MAVWSSPITCFGENFFQRLNLYYLVWLSSGSLSHPAHTFFPAQRRSRNHESLGPLTTLNYALLWSRSKGGLLNVSRFSSCCERIQMFILYYETLLDCRICLSGLLTSLMVYHDSFSQLH